MDQILINVLFLLVLLLITQHFFEVYTRILSKRKIKVFIFVTGLISIFFCMTFPLSIYAGFNIDIRAVPFIVASLYGGHIVSIGLYLFIVAYRYLIGFDQGFWGAIINYSIIPILTFIFYKRFSKINVNQKVLTSFFIVGIQILLSNYIYTYVFASNTPSDIIILGSIVKVATLILIVMTIERISHNYEMRRKLIDIEKMEILSHLSASISHEIRNGLTGAKGFIQLLKENEKDSQKQRYIKIALEELEKSENIIRDFLTFAKPAPEKIEIINIEQLINYTIEIINPLSNMNSIEIKKDLCPFWIMGEKKIIQQVFLNMFKNAIDAMPNGGELTISMKKDASKYEISIIDTGVGMDAEQIKRLGKPYFTTKGQKGTGLGLMVAYRVIEELNGEVHVQSKVGKGTTFTVSLPCTSIHNENVLFENGQTWEYVEDKNKKLRRNFQITDYR